MKSHITVNLPAKTLIMTKAFYKKASMYGTDEYAELRAAMLENVDFQITFRSFKKKTYHGLSFARMEEYIKTQPDSENRVIEFEAVKAIAKAKGSEYPLTKKWFFLTYPEYKENGVSEDETAAEIEKARAEAERKMALIEKAS